MRIINGKEEWKRERERENIYVYALPDSNKYVLYYTCVWAVHIQFDIVVHAALSILDDDVRSESLS